MDQLVDNLTDQQVASTSDQSKGYEPFGPIKRLQLIHDLTSGYVPFDLTSAREWARLSLCHYESVPLSHSESVSLSHSDSLSLCHSESLSISRSTGYEPFDLTAAREWESLSLSHSIITVSLQESVTLPL